MSQITSKFQLLWHIGTGSPLTKQPPGIIDPMTRRTLSMTRIIPGDLGKPFARFARTAIRSRRIALHIRDVHSQSRGIAARSRVVFEQTGGDFCRTNSPLFQISSVTCRSSGVLKGTGSAFGRSSGVAMRRDVRIFDSGRPKKSPPYHRIDEMGHRFDEA